MNENDRNGAFEKRAAASCKVADGAREEVSRPSSHRTLAGIYAFGRSCCRRIVRVSPRPCVVRSQSRIIASKYVRIAESGSPATRRSAAQRRAGSATRSTSTAILARAGDFRFPAGSGASLRRAAVRARIPATTNCKPYGGAPPRRAAWRLCVLGARRASRRERPRASRRTTVASRRDRPRRASPWREERGRAPAPTTAASSARSVPISPLSQPASQRVSDQDAPRAMRARDRTFTCRDHRHWCRSPPTCTPIL